MVYLKLAALPDITAGPGGKVLNYIFGKYIPYWHWIWLINIWLSSTPLSNKSIF